MAQIPTQILETVRECITALEHQNIHIERAVLFGSYAKGNYHDWSDIDLALVSKSFEGDTINDRRKVRYITNTITYDLEPLPYRPEDFTEDDPFVKEILETGVRVV